MCCFPIDRSIVRNRNRSNDETKEEVIGHTRGGRPWHARIASRKFWPLTPTTTVNFWPHGTKREDFSIVSRGVFIRCRRLFVRRLPSRRSASRKSPPECFPVIVPYANRSRRGILQAIDRWRRSTVSTFFLSTTFSNLFSFSFLYTFLFSFIFLLFREKQKTTRTKRSRTKYDREYTRNVDVTNERAIRELLFQSIDLFLQSFSFQMEKRLVEKEEKAEK